MPKASTKEILKTLQENPKRYIAILVGGFLIATAGFVALNVIAPIDGKNSARGVVPTPEVTFDNNPPSHDAIDETGGGGEVIVAPEDKFVCVKDVNPRNFFRVVKDGLGGGKFLPGDTELIFSRPGQESKIITVDQGMLQFQTDPVYDDDCFAVRQ